MGGTNPSLRACGRNTLRDHLESARARVQAAMELLLAAGLQVDTQTLQASHRKAMAHGSRLRKT